MKKLKYYIHLYLTTPNKHIYQILLTLFFYCILINISMVECMSTELPNEGSSEEYEFENKSEILESPTPSEFEIIEELEEDKVFADSDNFIALNASYEDATESGIIQSATAAIFHETFNFECEATIEEKYEAAVTLLDEEKKINHSYMQKSFRQSDKIKALETEHERLEQENAKIKHERTYFHDLYIQEYNNKNVNSRKDYCDFDCEDCEAEKSIREAQQQTAEAWEQLAAQNRNAGRQV